MLFCPVSGMENSSAIIVTAGCFVYLANNRHGMHAHDAQKGILLCFGGTNT